MTELRLRYIQDLRLRNNARKTRQTYVECVSLFARYFKRSREEMVSEPRHDNRGAPPSLSSESIWKHLQSQDKL